MRNKNKTVWSQRVGRANSRNFQRIGSSINIDKRLYNEDIFASIVHAEMLIKQRIIPKKDGIKIIKDFFGKLFEWKNLNDLIPKKFLYEKNQKRSGIAGILAGSLELAKEGNISIKQKKLFDDIFIKEINE